MNERFNKRSNRKIDWEKVKKQSGTISIIILVFVLVIFSATYYVVTNHNKIRETVSKNSETAAAKVIFISSGKGPHNAKYEFIVNGKRNTVRHSIPTKVWLETKFALNIPFKIRV